MTYVGAFCHPAGHADPGAYTPAAALGPDLAIAAGATFLLD